MDTWALYRLYDCDGALIYIGVSGKHDLSSRLASHRQDYPQMMERFATGVMEDFRHSAKAEAWAAEGRAIRAELPLFNCCHVRGRPTRGQAIRHAAVAKIVGTVER